MIRMAAWYALLFDSEKCFSSFPVILQLTKYYILIIILVKNGTREAIGNKLGA